MEPLRLRGIILHSTEFKEKDRLVSFLTSTKGLITICAKGTAKQGSHNAFVSVPFMVCDLVCTDSHGFYYLKDGTIIEGNSGIMQSLEALAVASHIADCLIESSVQNENSKDAYELAVYAYYCLSKSPERYKLICAAFNWRLLTILGLTAEYEVTSDLGLPIEDNLKYSLSIRGGSIVGKGSRFYDSTSAISGTSVKALNFFAEAPLNKLFEISASQRITNELYDFTVAYVSSQFDKACDALTVLGELDDTSD